MTSVGESGLVGIKMEKKDVRPHSLFLPPREEERKEEEEDKMVREMLCGREIKKLFFFLLYLLRSNHCGLKIYRLVKKIKHFAEFEFAAKFLLPKWSQSFSSFKKTKKKS